MQVLATIENAPFPCIKCCPDSPSLTADLFWLAMAWHIMALAGGVGKTLKPHEVRIEISNEKSLIYIYQGKY